MRPLVSLSIMAHSDQTRYSVTHQLTLRYPWVPSQCQLLPSFPHPLPTLGTYPRCLKFVLSHHFIEHLLCA